MNYGKQINFNIPARAGIFFISFLFLIATPLHAQIVINEFSANSDPEWVELFNAGSEEIQLADWKLVDASNKIASISGSIGSKGFFIFEREKGWLNNSGGDTLTLKDQSDSVVDSISYGGGGSPVGNLKEDKSAGRVPDGNGSWYTNLTWTKNGPNRPLDPSPESTYKPSQDPTPKIINSEIKETPIIQKVNVSPSANTKKVINIGSPQALVLGETQEIIKPTPKSSPKSKIAEPTLPPAGIFFVLGGIFMSASGGLWFYNQKSREKLV